MVYKQDKTHFEFQKENMIHDIFDSIAFKYDIMNDIMSAGIHRLWKERFINKLNPCPSIQLLDVAGGTGDIAFRFLKKGGGSVIICDTNYKMINIGRTRAINNGFIKNIHWTVGNAHNLPFPDCSIDQYTISFGLRNVTMLSKALSESYRVLRPGGKFQCLEFSKVILPIFNKLYDIYSFKIIPKIGYFITGKKEPYQYLVESIRIFPDQDILASMIRKAGFKDVHYQNLSGGIAAIHCGYRV